LLIFGHAGVTLGTAALLNGLFTGVVPDDDVPEKSSSGGLFSWFARLSQRLDLRILLIGALLPDIIDKPLGHIFFREYLSSGRTIGHTLLFAILLALGGLIIRFRTGKSWMLILSAGAFFHLILDEMWLSEWRATILWPLYGLEFPKSDITGWIGNIWEVLLREPAVYVPEIIGGTVILLFLWVLVRNGSFRNFLKRGRLSGM
jgi:hypothetical protein